MDAVDAILWQALRLWDTSGDGDAVDAAIEQLEIQVRDLPGSQLARVVDGGLWIDVNAAGHGWFVDPRPGDSEEFRYSVLDDVWSALDDGPAAGQVDLLSVLAHELGHLLGAGHVHDDSHDVMSETLSVGVRRLPVTTAVYSAAVDQAFRDDVLADRVDLSRFFASAMRT